MSSKTYDSIYNKPLKYKIEIWDAIEEALLYTSNGFNVPASNLVVEKITINQIQWETWDATITIDDSVYNNLDLDKFDNGCVMKIYFGKDESSVQNAFYGIVDSMGPTRLGGDKISYDVSAKGFGVVPNYTYVDFQKVPPSDTLKPGANLTNPLSIPFFANNLVKSLWGDINIMPVLDNTLSERMGNNFSMAGISDAVKDFIPGIKNPLVTAAQIMNLLSQMSGAIWYVDQYKNLQFRYPKGDNSGIIIKDYYEDTDSGDYTAYVKGGTTFAYKDSTRPEDGFVQQLFAIAEKIDIQGQQSKAVAFTSLYNKNLAFATVPGPSKFSNMTFILSKIGAGTDDPNPATSKVRGLIVSDVNHSPTGDVIGEFAINISDISDTPAPVIKIDRPILHNISYDKLYWIVLFERGSGENNTIRVWHDDDVTTASTLLHPRYSAIQPNTTNSTEFDTDGWFVSAQGPEFSISFATTENIIVEASDPLSIARWSPGRPVQSRASAPSLKSVQATQAYLNLVVSQTAQKIRLYDNLEVSIPNNLITPGTEIQLASDRIRDLAFENDVVAEVKSVSYNLDVTEYAIGSKYCTVSLRGYVSPLT